tara:strand:+ start:149 stop:838 length:690 start_codon:yes stop_codon:yes gene_type:complete
MSASDAATAVREPTEKEIRLVIAASSAGTIFEWYDFFIYGTLAGLIGAAFFPSGNETLQILLVWAGFAVGFGFRPLGAILFGFLGDRLGRKYTFLVTVTLMGIATAGVGLIPSAATIGIAAPIIVILFRILQGACPWRRIWRCGDLCRGTCPARKARVLHQLHPGQRGGRICAFDHGGAGVPLADPGGRFCSMGLARAVPALDHPAADFTVDAPEAFGKPRVPGDEGGR